MRQGNLDSEYDAQKEHSQSLHEEIKRKEALNSLVEQGETL